MGRFIFSRLVVGDASALKKFKDGVSSLVERVHLVALPILVCLIALPHANAQFTQQGSKLVGTGAVGGAHQGASVSISADGNTAIVGGDIDNTNAGGAWVFTRSSGVWSQQGSKLVGIGAVGSADQGNSVSISADGNTALIGGSSDSSNVGAAWVFTRSGGVWIQQGNKLVGTGAVGASDQGFRVSLSSDGNTALVGGLLDNSSAGAVWVFTRSGGVWSQQGSKLVGTGATGNARQGSSVSLSSDGNTAIVGGNDDNSSAGAAWVWTRSGGVWTQQGNKLVGTGAVGNAHQGNCVSLSSDGNTALIGGSSDSSNVGAAWVFTRSGGVWTQQGNKLVGTGAVGGANQGISVSLSSDGNAAIVGGDIDNSAAGASWVWTRSGGVWSQQGSKLVGTGAVGGAGQGYSVSLSSDSYTAIVGGYSDNGTAGAAWIFATPNASQPIGTWATKAPIPSASYGLGGAFVGGKFYAISGFATTRVAVYDPAINTWSNVAPLPQLLQYFGTIVLDGKIYVVGGDTGGGGDRATLYCYDPALNTWTSLASMPLGSRYRLGVATINGKIYAVGGANVASSTYLSRLEVYDPLSNTWATKASMPVPGYGGVVGAINGKLLVAGGSNASGPLTALYVYDPVTDGWSTKTSMPFTAGYGVVLGGKLFSIDASRVLAYNEATDSWSSDFALMPTARVDFGVAADELNNKIYAVAGYYGGDISALEVFNLPSINSPSVNVTFRLNTKFVNPPISLNDTVGLRGGDLIGQQTFSPLSWGSSRRMTLSGGDSIYSTTVSFPGTVLHDTLQYKFYIGRQNGAFKWEDSVGVGDPPNYNRTVVLSDTLINLSVGYFNNINSVSPTTTWRMQIQSQIASAMDNENYAGVADSASENLDSLYDTPEPSASPGDYISLFFPHPEWGSLLGNNFAKDIKRNTLIADTVKRWYFQVKSNVVNDTVALTFVNDRIPLAFGKYLTDLKTGKRINLKNISIYKYFNTSDTTRSFMLIIGDSTAPHLTLTSPNGSNIWRSGTSKNIVWSTSDRTGIDSIFVYLSFNGGSSYSLLRSLAYVQTTGWTIPNEYLNNNYSIKLVSRDSLGNQSTVKSGKTFTVVGDSLATSNPAGWSMISAPLPPNDSSISNIFGNSSYLWSYTQSTGYTQPSKITLGNGYWLGVTATKNWFVKGIANETDSSVQNLQLGYNIIGNNFVRNVSKNSLYFLKSGSYYNFSAAVTAGLISNTLYGYSSSAYSSVDTMSLFGGYWIGVLQSGVQLIERPNVSIVTPLAKQAQIFAMNWELPIKVTTAALTDNIAMIGITPTSTNQFDAQYDAPRPPRNPGSNYLELYFTNTGGNYPAILGSKYARDFRDSSSAQWNFAVESSQNGDVTLGWDKTLLEGLSGTLNLKLTDVAIGQTLDMKTVPTYTFSYSAPRQFVINAKITGVGKENDILPTDYTLSQNFPNPFNPSTTIRYALPSRSSAKIVVTNTLGQEVAVLMNGEQEAGYHEVEWRANVASGMYFYRLESVSVSDPNNRFVQVKKMLLLK